MSPEIWREDIRRAKTGLQEGQILIVSVVATPDETCSLEYLIKDYSQCALWAREAGADVIEANLSCPNVCSAEGSLYQDPSASGRIASALRECLGKTPLLLKIGEFEHAGKLDSFLHAVSHFVDGVILVNCIVRPVLRGDGSPVFGKEFQRAGVAGRLIHKPALANTRQAMEIIRKQNLPLAVIANGGASTHNDIADFFSAGASAVLFGSSPMYLPNLAAEAKRLHPEW
jgi:dihydroorotate dehydrogenase